MKNFLKYTLATIVGIVISFFVVLLIAAGIIGGISASKEKTITVKPNTVINISLPKVVERQALNPFADFDLGNKKNTVEGLNRILKTIEAAKTDDNIKGLYLNAGTFNSGGLATLESIRQALTDFHSTGKFIYAYAEIYSQKAYYLSSVADKIVVNPAGSIDIKGMGAQLLFFKNALDRLGVQVQIIRGPNNKFKSAVEPFMYDKMSKANREQMMVFMGSIWGNMVNQMAGDRNISVEKFNEIADSLWANNPVKAKELHIVDQIAYYDQVKQAIKEKLEVKKDKDLNMISLGEYATTVKRKNITAKNKIAIIYAVGEIKSGEGNDKIIGSERIAKAVAKARKDSSIKAIVLRVNSPGGSALASEVIWRELVLAKKVKPLVVSMGDYAASGGYFISCMADKIVAEPNTLTGSIGVFGMIPNFKKLMNDKLGITTDEVATNSNTIMGVFNPLTPYQRKSIQNSVVRVYNAFVNHVAQGRNMTPADVDKIGQGRVWSGSNAVKIGLVDELGDINKAIKIAANLANVKKYKIVERPARINPIEEFVKQFGNNVKIKLMQNELGQTYKYYNYLKTMENCNGIQARLPFIMEIN